MNPAHDPAPAWQTDDCPAWCVVGHRDDDLPADRVHDSAGLLLTVALAPPGLQGGDDQPETTELTLRTSRPCGQRTDWIFIGEEHRRRQHVHLSRESAHRLVEALQEHLDATE